MERKLIGGDYVPDGRGGLETLSREEALLQRVLFRLTARRGQFPFLPNMGSRLYQLGREKPSARQALATQYAAEALRDEAGLEVTGTQLDYGADRLGQLTVFLRWQGEDLSVSMALQS